MGLVAVPQREPRTKVGFQIRHSLNSFDQLGVHCLLVILLELRQVLGCLKDTGRFTKEFQDTKKQGINYA